MSNEELINSKDINNPDILKELKGYSDEFTPDQSMVLDDMIRGGNVNLSDLQQVMRDLFEYVVKDLDRDQGARTRRMARLEDILAELGGQL